jgi:serine/threonine-protein kinase
LRKKVLKLFIALAVLVVAFYFAFNVVMSILVHDKGEVIVPGVVGRNLCDALEELSSAGCGLKKDGEEFNQNVPAGIVLRQNPPAGMNVKEGKIVKVTVSQGGETVCVPSLAGKTIRSADISLRNSSLVMGEVSKKYSAIADEGMVLSQDIAAGTAVDRDTVVNIVVSDGHPPDGLILMPDFVNKNVEKAKAWALEYGFAVNVAGKDISAGGANIIVRQSPEADSDVTNLKSSSLWLK